MIHYKNIKEIIFTIKKMIHPEICTLSVLSTII